MGTCFSAEERWVDMARAEFGIQTKEQGDHFLICQERLKNQILIRMKDVVTRGAKINLVDLGLSYPTISLNLGLYTSP